MAGFNTKSSDDSITGINVTPLVDVVLVLLIIFMITAPLIYQSSIKVELPAARSGDKNKQVTLKFTIMADRTVLLADKPIAGPEIEAAVKDALAKDPQANAIVSADKSLSHGHVMEVIDSLKSAGISRLAIGVNTSPDSRESNQNTKPQKQH